jgi:hypothetical protein
MVHPRTVHVDLAGTELRSFEVIAADDVRHVVQFVEPLPLPAP